MIKQIDRAPLLRLTGMIKPLMLGLLMAMLFAADAFLLSSSVVAAASNNSVSKLFATESLTVKDSVLVTRVTQSGDQVDLFKWQAGKPLIPASMVKLATSFYAIKKWGLGKRFETYFYRQGDTLWVRGSGDPFLVSEELDLVVKQLHQVDVSQIDKIAVDDFYFAMQTVPGRSGVRDPYNAPLNALSANFNTVKLVMANNVLASAEPQTPLTPTAKRVAAKVGVSNTGKAERINLIDSANASTHFAELLSIKLGLKDLVIVTGQAVPQQAKLIYTHKNSHTLADIVRGMLEYSNNFMANQLFLMFGDTPKASFSNAADLLETYYQNEFGWKNFSLVDGAGLSRKNRLSARQVNRLLTQLSGSKQLLKSYKVNEGQVWAKTGTLNGVRSFAGFISKNDINYQFVFNFNRAVPYRYREALMKRLVASL